MKNGIEPINYVLPMLYYSKEGNRIRLLIKNDRKTKQDWNILSELLDYLGNNRIETEIIHAFPTDDNNLLIDMILRLKEKDGKALDKLKKFLEEMKEKQKIEYHIACPTPNNIIFDPAVRTLMMPKGHRVVVWGEPNIIGVYVKLRMEHGELGKILIEKLGEYVGQELAKYYMSQGVKDLSDGMKSLVYGGQAKGSFFVKEFKHTIGKDRVYFRIVLEHHIEEEALMKSGFKECSSYQTGVFRGFLEAYTGKTTSIDQVKQLKCIGKGDEYSIFVIEARK